MRAEMLIEYADRFREVPPDGGDAAVRRAPPRAALRVGRLRVGHRPRPTARSSFHFAVENPQGLSAKAWAVILDETLSGQPLEQVAKVPGDVVFDIFGRELSMGKGQGLLGMLDLVQFEVKQRLRARRM